VSRYRILHIITRLEQGGAPLTLLETVQRLDRKQFEIDLVAGQTEDIDRNLDLSDSGFDLPIISVPTLRRSVHPFRDLRALFHLIRIIKSGDYDVVHTHTSKAGILGRLAASICGVRVIVHSSHGTILHGYFSPAVTAVFALFEKIVAAMSHKIICLTRKEIREYLEAGIGREDQFTYIFNGIDIEAFESRVGDRQSLRKELRLEQDHVVCVSVGRLVPVKGQCDLLDAFAEAYATSPELRLLLVGDGELRKDLEEQIERLGIGEVTRLVGWREDVAELLDACDIFVLTSLNEGLGLVLVEAMAKKLPVVATAVGGVPEVVDDGQTGHLVPAQDPSAIAAAITHLAANKPVRTAFGQNGCARAHQVFSIDQTVAHTETLYRDLLGKSL
jgi:glycosyltransferase involved in cell wall biosynthesis